MQAVALAGHAPAAIDLNQPGSYLNWNFFTISVANLVLIAVMVAIFGAALLLPFPRARGGEGPATAEMGPEPVPAPPPWRALHHRGPGGTAAAARRRRWRPSPR